MYQIDLDKPNLAEINFFALVTFLDKISQKGHPVVDSNLALTGF